MSYTYLKNIFCALVLSFSYYSFAGEVEVLHWWTSASEAEAVNVLKKLLEKEGHTWKDFAVAGGGGENAMTVLKSRVVSGNAPTAAQIKGPAIQEWASMGVNANLDAVAKAENWDNKIYGPLIDHLKYNKHYVAVPVNIHRVNWLWVNPSVFKKAKVKVPTTWQELESAAQALEDYAVKNKLKDFTPIAHGGQNWQDATVFEAIVLSEGGSKLYTDAFINLKKEALTGAAMQNAFKKLRTYKQYTDKGSTGRDWNQATAMVIKGSAGMQIMGDWAKGEFVKAGKKPGVDYLCVPVPGTQGDFTYNVDSFVMFKNKNPKSEAAQNAMAKLILQEEFQKIFNTNKGSVPVNKNIKDSEFDACGQQSIKDINASISKKSFLPSMAHGMSSSPAVQGAIFDVVTNFFNSQQSEKEAAEKLYQSIKASQ
ncbi:MAG TPA: ABC transporter substrate-binding protein [Oligoflexia bacterium]|nr:ABC transporter substrate-binding protein [Oligoflexia bacterium]HMR24932.1 ABC transporter substrate-binding protein [Oligoflexia bacterium]